VRDQQFGLRLVDHASRTRLPNDVFSYHLGEKLRPFRAFLDICVFSRKEIVRCLARNLAIGEDFAPKPRNVLRRYASSMQERGNDRAAVVDAKGHCYCHVRRPSMPPVSTTFLASRHFRGQWYESF
jgi:hypothetical protein